MSKIYVLIIHDMDKYVSMDFHDFVVEVFKRDPLEPFKASELGSVMTLFEFEYEYNKGGLFGKLGDKSEDIRFFKSEDGVYQTTW